MKKFLAALVCSLPLAMQTTVSVAEDLSLEPEAIEGLFPGHYEAQVAGGYRLLIAAKSDGTMMGRAFGREDKGKWVIKDEELCISWRSWTRGKYKCGSIMQNGEWYVATNTQDGETMKFKPVSKREVYSASVNTARVRD